MYMQCFEGHKLNHYHLRVSQFLCDLALLEPVQHVQSTGQGHGHCVRVILLLGRVSPAGRVAVYLHQLLLLLLIH